MDHDERDPIQDIEDYLTGSPVLERVIPVNTAVAALGGGRVVIASVEVWSSRITIQYSVVGTDGLNRTSLVETGNRYRAMQVLRDDVGTTYALVGAGGSGGGDVALQFSQHQATYLEG